jgi:hypothetical protein
MNFFGEGELDFHALTQLSLKNDVLILLKDKSEWLDHKVLKHQWIYIVRHAQKAYIHF